MKGIRSAIKRDIMAISSIYPTAFDLYDEPLQRLIGRLAETFESHAKSRPECTWAADIDGVWETSCSRAFCLTEGEPKDNDYRFCPSCGGKLIEKPYQEEDDE